MKLIVIRHGESDANVTEIMSSKVSDDVRLTAHGRTQVQGAAKYITEKIDALFVSPLKRTVQTAEILATIKKLPDPTFSSEVREVNYGKYSGQKNDSVLDTIRKQQVDGDYAVRFGENGENKYEIEKRILEFLISLVSTYGGRDNVLVVTHGSISSWIGRFVAAATGSTLSNKEVQNGDIRKYYINKSHIRSFKKMLRNVESHAPHKQQIS